CALMGCQQDQQPPSKVDTTHSHIIKKEATIVIPPAVADRWKAVRIAVVDKSNVSRKLYTIPIGGKLAIPSSALVIEVVTFLPAFTMEGSIMTSSSNELKNPGVKVRITENGSVLFKGWLFSMFPKTHAFMHPKYGFILVDVVPVRK
ncbi:MAG: DUF2155 domain-containing protein, partial [Verrucomicrobia bacterium]|nr:DUF2155 domain-containing protein [Deltaproteobacteria bacterium]